MILVTGANGQLGRLVINGLLKTTPPADIVAGVRSPEKASDISALGVTVRTLDYDRPETISDAVIGVQTVILISGSELGKRFAQHQNVINAAKVAGVTHIIYTSILNADDSPLVLADEHRQTEAAIHQSGLPFTILRNGWYIENYAGFIGGALAQGTLIGSSKEGRISGASRGDYADAIVAIASHPITENRTIELAGSRAFTLTELAAELSAQSGKSVQYVNLPESEYVAALISVGLPQPLAEVLGNAEVGASAGALFSESKALETLIGRETTTLKAVVATLV